MKKIFFLLFLFCSVAYGQNKMPLKQSPAGFTPADLTPLLWYNSNSAKMASDGSLWIEENNADSLIAAGTTKPTYNSSAQNGRPGFVFDGVNDNLSSGRITAIQNIQNLTIIMVSKRGTISQDDAGTTNETTIYHYSDDNIYTIFTNLKYGGTTTPVTNAFHYTISLFDGTQTGDANRLKMRIDGVAKTLGFGTPIPSVTENNASSTLHVGLFYGNTYLAGTMCEFIIVARTITAGEITSVESYLATKYGL